jgi:endo-1,4-beta-xylanase
MPAAAQRQAPPPATWVDADRSTPAGTEYRTFFSRTLGAEVSYLLYLPPGYAGRAAKRYPVIYWLHGLNGGQTTGARIFLPPVSRTCSCATRRVEISIWS